MREARGEVVSDAGPANASNVVEEPTTSPTKFSRSGAIPAVAQLSEGGPSAPSPSDRAYGAPVKHTAGDEDGWVGIEEIKMFFGEIDIN